RRPQPREEPPGVGGEVQGPRGDHPLGLELAFQASEGLRRPQVVLVTRNGRVIRACNGTPIAPLFPFFASERDVNSSIGKDRSCRALTITPVTFPHLMSARPCAAWRRS